MNRLKIRTCSAVVFLLCVSLVLCSALFAQEGLSTLRGTVTDTSGAIMPGVSVTAREVLTNVVVRTVLSDDQGNYEMPALKAGLYQVTATQPGFKKFVVDDVRLTSNQIRRIEISLEVGEVATEVIVSAAAAAIQTEEGKISSVFKAGEQYGIFPVPGNAFSGTYAILAVLPDVQRAPGDWGSPTLAGQGGNQVHMAQDGVKEETLNSQTVNMEAVAELKAVSVNNTADYARPGYFDTITKSGGNDFHAEGNYYHRNSAVGARNFFEDQKTKIIYHTFNVAASGPIVKDKTFFYALWNAERVPGSFFYLRNVPTAKMRAGDFSAFSTPIRDPLTGQAFSGNIIPPGRISNVAKVVQSDLLPLPNRGNPDVPVNNYGFVFPYPDDQFHADVFSVRVDHHLTEKNSLYGRIQGYLPRYVLAGNYPAMNWTRLRQSHSWIFTDTHVFSPTVVNTFSFGGNRDGIKDNEKVDGIQPASGASLVQKMGLQGVNKGGIDSPGGSPVFSITGFSTIQIRQGGFQVPNLNYNVADSATWAKGRHIIKAGGELRTYSSYSEQVSNDNFGNFQFNGSFSGNAYADFLLGLPRRSIRLDPLTNRKRTSKELGLFITETFKVSTKLTLDLGLRWDYFSATTWDDGLMFNWDPVTGNVIVPQEARGKVRPLYPPNITIVNGNPVAEPDKRNFVPRFGVAYRLSDKMVVRGGYGLFNEFLGKLARLSGAGPFEISETYFNSITNGVPQFQMPNPFPTSLVSASIPSQSVTAFPKTRNGMIHQFNVSVERQIADMGLRLSYIGSRNRNMNYAIGINKPQASLIPFTASRRPYPQFVGATVYRTDGATNYDSLSSAINRRVGWVTFDIHWTWAHAMNNMLNTQNPYTPLVWNRDFLAKHRVVFNTMWELPFGRGKKHLNSISPAADHLLGGWTVAWVAYAQTGQYFSPEFSDADPSNTNSFGGLPDRVCNGNLPAGERSLDRWFDTRCFVNPPAGRYGNSGANILEGPGMHAHNVTVVKKFKFTERISFDFMTLISNIFNHPNFLFPTADISTSGVGVIGETHGLYSGERAGPRMIEFRVRLRF